MKKEKFIYYVLTFLAPIITFYLFEWYIHNPFEIKIHLQLLNILLYELLMVTLLFITGSARAAIIIQTVFFMLAGLTNYYVLEFRSIPIMPWDIFSVGTAVSVANNYKYTIEKNTIFVLIGFILLILIESRVKVNKLKDWRIRVAGLAVSLLCIFGFSSYMHQESTIVKLQIYDKLFTPTVVSKRNGGALAFVMELKYLSIDKPAGYSKDAVNKLIGNQESYNELPQKTPNIIVIMNEAFSEPAILGDFETNIDYMPFIHSMMDGQVENAFTGYLNVSVLGGNTANTEFEFLTGNTMAFLPNGCVPYQQYLKKEVPSVASVLKSYGYRTVAMHPYNSTGWERNRVYPLLGFDEMYFIRDWKKPEKIRKYVSDKSCYDKIIDIYENKDEDTPLFVFNVTMQNHSSYSEEFENFKPDVKVNNSSSKILPNYLSLLKLSDEAIEELINYFENEDEETIIVFFGDHQTTNSVMSPIWKLNNKSADTLSETEQNNRYKVPFFIWSNYELDTDGTIPAETSANFLGATALKAANIPLDGYFKFISDLSTQYPIVTAIRSEDINGNSSEIKDALKNKPINDYSILQYYFMFDNK